MKKFLSLVLALVMTMSLVTIGAGATDYSDLTDKSDVQYTEAVAVLNKLGIITGYEDGSFKPTGALTRGAAAKIIVSLMIGSEAASNLTVAAAPYKDVTTTNTFAGVISYCKTAGYINGYSDGTFRPTASLTGYAFAKMLLGALGYDGKIEGFTGSGWTMNVAKLGNVAGLFDNFKTSFQGNAGVTREGACLLALNTLKATEVEYSGGTNVVAGDASVVINATRDYKTSNNTNINQNIGKGTTGNNSNNYTLEFGEDHFADLKLINQGTARDDFGRPSNKWSYKNVAIGTYALTPDYTFTTRASGDTATDKLKSMGLNDLNFSTTVATSSGSVTYTAALYMNSDTAVTTFKSGDNTKTLTFAKNTIPDLAGNGRLIEVYLKDGVADQIDSVVVVDTYLMQIKKVTSTGVTLKNPESNRVGVTLNEVKSDDNCYAALSALKADDYVLVTVSDNDVMSVTVPQTVTGKLSAFTAGSHNQTGVNNITVAGTKYNLALKADSADSKLSASTTLTSTNNTTAYLDTYGNVIYATDVESGSDYFIFDEMYTSTVDGRNTNMAQGWDLSGSAVSLNLGTNASNNGISALVSGGVYKYSSSTTSNAEYKIEGGYDKLGTFKAGVKANNVATIAADLPKMSASDVGYHVSKGDSQFDGGDYYDGSVKFSFVGWDGADVDSITVKDGVQETTASSQVLVAIQNDNNTRVQYVVVFNDTDVEASANVLYVKSADGTATNASGKTVTMFDAYIDGTLQTGLVASKQISGMAGKFYTYSVTDGVYSVNEFTKLTKDTSVLPKATYTMGAIYNATRSNNAYLVPSFDNTVTNVDGTTNTYVASKDLKVKNADVIDCSGDGWNVSSLEDLNTVYVTLRDKLVADGTYASIDAADTAMLNDTHYTVDLAFVFNGNPNSSDYGTVATLYVRDITPGKA